MPLLKDYFLYCLYQRALILLPLSKGPFFYCPHLWSWSHSQWLAERRICLAVWVSLYPLLPLLSPHQTFIKVKWCILLHTNMWTLWIEVAGGLKQANLNLIWLWFLYPFYYTNTYGEDIVKIKNKALYVTAPVVPYRL